MKSSWFRFCLSALILLLCLVLSCEQQPEEMQVEEKTEAEAVADLELDKIPKVVMDALKARFPNAEIHKWTKEKEGDIGWHDPQLGERDRGCGPA